MKGEEGGFYRLLISMEKKNENIKAMLFDILKNNDELYVVDTETTGLSAKKDYIIQFSAKKYSIINEPGKIILKEIGMIDEYIKPPFYISKQISELTGITNEKLKAKPNEDTVFGKIKAFMGESPAFFAYNEAFDFRMIDAMYMRNKDGFLPSHRFDVMKAAKDLINKEKVDSFKQEEIATKCHVTEGIQFHSAIDDVECTKRLLQLFINQYIKKEERINEKSKERLEEQLSEEKPISESAPKKIVSVSSVQNWNKYGKKRLYVTTNAGTVFFDGKWNGKDVAIEAIDIPALEKEVFQKIGEDLKEEFFTTSII